MSANTPNNVTDDSVSVYLEGLKHRFSLELRILRKAFPFILFGAFMTFLHSVMTNVVYYLYSHYEVFNSAPLHDMGFELLPEIPESAEWVIEFLTFGVLGTTILWGASFFLLPSQNAEERKTYVSLLFARFLGTSGVTLVGRIMSFLSTLLPAPSEHCHPSSPVFNPPSSVLQVIFRLDAIYGCGDLIYSSHTCYVLLCTLLYYRYGKSSAVKGLYLSVAGTLAVLIISARKHYSVDVWLAWYVVPICWYAGCQRFPDGYFLSGLENAKETALADNNVSDGV